MRKLFIIFFMLIGCCEPEIKICNMAVLISDGLPFQFWPEGQDTFNEEIVNDCMEKSCYIKEWPCSAEVKLRFAVDGGGGVLGLTFKDSNGDEIIISPPYNYDLAFSKNKIALTNLSIPALTEWVGHSGDPAWSLGASPSIPLPITVSSRLEAELVGFGKGIYKVDFTVFKDATYTGEVEIRLLKEGTEVGRSSTFISASGVISDQAVVKAIEAPDQIQLYAKNSSGSTGNLQVISVSLAEAQSDTYYHEVSFDPSLLNNPLCESIARLGLSSNILPSVASGDWEDFNPGLGEAWSLVDSSFARVVLSSGGDQSHYFVVSAPFDLTPGPGSLRKARVAGTLSLPAGPTYSINLKQLDSDDNVVFTTVLGVGVAGNQLYELETLTFLQEDTDRIGIEVVTSGGSDDVQVDLYGLFVAPLTNRVARTDLINFTSYYQCLLKVEYKGNSYFERIYYDNFVDYFTAYFPAKLFFESSPHSVKEQKTIEGPINTGESITLQRKLVTDFMPGYEHRKLQVILAHATNGEVLIKGYNWFLQEYSQNDPPEDNYPQVDGKATLSRSDYYVRNLT